MPCTQFHCDSFLFYNNVLFSVCSTAPQPQYTLMREPVDGNLPDFMVMEIQLPGMVCWFLKWRGNMEEVVDRLCVCVCVCVCVHVCVCVCVCVCV